MRKKKIGIIGGMGAHAGAWLLQRILHLSPAEKDQDYPEVILHSNSRIPDRTEALLQDGASPLPELKRSIEYFNSGRVDVCVMACMTAHYYHDQLQTVFNGTLLNAMDMVMDELSVNSCYAGKKTVGLIGSSGLLASGLLQQRLLNAGITPVTLDEAEQETYFMQPIYMQGGIKSGVLSGTPQQLFLRQIDILRDKGAELIVGACSEVPLVCRDIPAAIFIDAFDLLARKTVEYSYNN